MLRQSLVFCSAILFTSSVYATVCSQSIICPSNNINDCYGMSSSWQIDPDTIQNYTAGKYSFDLASGENGVANPADSTCRYVIRQNNQVVSSFTIKSGRYHPSTIYPNWVRQGDSNTYNCRGLSTYCPYNP